MKNALRFVCLVFAASLLSGSFFSEIALASPPAKILKPIELEKTAGGNRLKVRIHAPENGCSWGDLDAILLELKHTKTPRLLVSIEPLSGSPFTPLTTDISSFDLEKGFVTTFLLPAFSKPTAVAFYICKDSERKNRCGSKQAVPPQTVLQSYLTPMDPKTGKLGAEPKDVAEATDKIYYFAPLVVAGSNAFALKNMLSAEEYDELNGYLKSIGVSAETASKIRETNDLMDSVQPVAQDTLISLSLPHINKEACAAPPK